MGSGAGGGVIASRLAEAGRDVLVVEAGPYVAEPDMPTDELAAFDRLYLDHGMTSSADLAVAILAGSALGGGTLVNWATCIEPPPWIRHEWATEYGLTDFDAVETDADLARLRTELGFCPPPSIGPKDQAILDGAAALGWEPHQLSAAPTAAATAARAASDAGAARSYRASNGTWPMRRATVRACWRARAWTG